ncbi:hypothetical protein J2768_000542 [Agrobacterium tumefaciens]|uniref:phage tail tape measure protein n=1 Tax=Agrobacterium tumefaciens TaxID=358 RepID=UPI001AE9E08C|nr:phage tail tape measure protein [Agrobacterium tumefaciens]MBP2538144.1 hypothetical protein [Agrobacterium tumefaciens]
MSVNAEATVTLSLVDKITGPIKRLGARLSGFGKKLGFDKIAKATSNFGNSIRGLGDGLARTSGRLAAFLGVLGAGGAGAIASAYGLAKSASDLGSEIFDASKKLGIGTEALSEWMYAADQAGVSGEAFQKGVEKLGINAVEATKGNKQMAAAFKTLGVRVKGAKGQMRPMEDILDDTVGALAGMKDPLKRNQLAFKVFGKSGVELTKIMADGADGIREAREEARKIGVVWGQSAADAADEFGDGIVALQKRLLGFKTFLGVQLIPVFNEAVKIITEWVGANADLIRSTITEWASRLVRVIRSLIDPTSEVRVAFREFGESLSTFGSYIKPIVDRFGALNTALAAVALWITGPLLTAIALVGIAFVKLGAAILATPIGWILAGVAALAASVYVLYQRWDEFLAYWGNLWQRVKDGFNQGFIIGIITLLKEFNPVTHIVRGMNAVIEYFNGYDVLNMGHQLIMTLTRGITESAQELGKAIEQALVDAWAAYEAWWNGFSENVRGAGAAIVTALWEGLKAKWAEMVAWVKSAIAELLSYLPESLRTSLGFDVSATVEPITDAAKAATEAVKPAATAAQQATDAGARMGAMFNAPANDNASGGESGSGVPQIVAGDTNNTTTINANIAVTAKTDANPQDIGAAVRRELDGVAKRAAAGNGSRLND